MTKTEIRDFYRDTLDMLEAQTTRFNTEALVSFLEDLSLHNDHRLPLLKKSDDGKTLNLIHENSMEEVLNDENLTECIRKLDLIKNEVKKAG
mgnify:CR=1 FL=1